MNQKGFSSAPIIGALILLSLIGAYFLRSSSFNSNSEIDNSSLSLMPSPSVKRQMSQFQELLVMNCKDNKMAPAVLPLKIKLLDLKDSMGVCDSGVEHYNNFVYIPLEKPESEFEDVNLFLTISDSLSNHCCHGPSSIEPTGKLIKTEGDTSIYLHTGTWGAGPNAGYKPIVVRGVKSIKLDEKQEIRVVLDRLALGKTNDSLQKLEDKYQVIDPDFNSGAKVLTPEAADKMLNDDFFADFANSAVVKKVESDLQSIAPASEG